LIPDADDTAKTILSLQLCGESVDAIACMREFERETHFETYPGERDASFTTNCNILLALSHLPDSQRWSAQIDKATAFLCDKWWKYDGEIIDKWVLDN
jgi:hypothetical protein